MFCAIDFKIFEEVIETLDNFLFPPVDNQILRVLIFT